jgi:hypothetical protein
MFNFFWNQDAEPMAKTDLCFGLRLEALCPRTKISFPRNISTLSFTFAGMGFLDQIKARWAMVNIKVNTSRGKKVSGLQHAKRIGIIYEATDREIFEVVRDFINELREQQKDISSLGFVNVKYEEEIPKSKLGMDFFGPKSLNFGLKSADITVHNFVKEKFDVLLDLNLDANPVLLNITADSKSGFIIGNGDEGKIFRDLYFENEAKDKPASMREAKLKQLQTLIDNIKKYATRL